MSFSCTFLQWLLALVSNLHPAEVADTALADVRRRPSIRRSKDRCQCLPSRDLGPPCSAGTRAGLTTRHASAWTWQPLLSSFYCSGQQDPDELVHPATFTQLRDEPKRDEGGSTFVLPARAFVCLSQHPSIPGKRDAVIFI